MLLVVNADGHVLLERRPADGLWGGLWALPEIDTGSTAARWCRDRLGCDVREETRWSALRHGFTHFELEIEPRLVTLDTISGPVMEDGGRLWYNPATPPRIGLAAVVTRLLSRLESMQPQGA